LHGTDSVKDLSALKMVGEGFLVSNCVEDGTVTFLALSLVSGRSDGADSEPNMLFWVIDLDEEPLRELHHPIHLLLSLRLDYLRLRVTGFRRLRLDQLIPMEP